MKKAIGAISIIAAALQFVYVTLSIIYGVICVVVNTGFFASEMLPMIFAATARLAIMTALVFILIFSNARQSKKIIAEIIGMIVFSGIGELINALISALLSLFDIGIYENGYFDFYSAPAWILYVSFISAIAAALMITACALSLAYKKTGEGKSVKKTIALFAILSSAVEILYLIIGTGIFAPVLFKFKSSYSDLPKELSPSRLFALMVIPVALAAVFVFVIALITIVSNKKGSKRIIAEIFGIVCVSGIFDLPIMLMRCNIIQLYRERMSSLSVDISQLVSSINVFGFFEFLSIFSFSFLVIACTLSIASKKSKATVGVIK